MESDAHRIWDIALGQLQLQVTRPNYDTWLRETQGLRFDDGHFIIGTHSDFTSQWLATKMAPLITKTISNIVGKPLEVTFELIPPNGHDPKAPLFRDDDGQQQTGAKTRLNHKFTFERFIVGDSNRLALTAAMAIADQPGEVYNPLFIYGPTGLGKTHLLHAISQRAAKRSLRWAYLCGERFTNEFLTALHQDRLDDFRRKYRSVQILLLDDIQFLAGKAHTQEEFFYTFNELHAAGCQLVAASDQPPRALSGLAARLRSRLQSGLIADIQPPDYQTRLAIVQAKACEQSAQLAEGAAALIASRVAENVRDLESCLNRCLALAQLQRSPITPAIALQAITTLHPQQALASQQPSPAASSQATLQAVATYFNLPLTAITGESRSKPIADARHVAMFLLREDASLALKAIGQLFGNRDHSTVIHACAKVSHLIKSDPSFKNTIAELRTSIPRLSTPTHT